MKQTIPDQIRAAIREFGRATEDEIAAALPASQMKDEDDPLQ